MSAPTYRAARAEHGLWAVVSPSGITLGLYPTVSAAADEARFFERLADERRRVAS